MHTVSVKMLGAAFMTILIECVVLCVLFTLAVVTVSLKDPLAGVNNWPPAIQQRARELGLIQSEQMVGSKKVYIKSWWLRWSLPPFLPQLFTTSTVRGDLPLGLDAAISFGPW